MRDFEDWYEDRLRDEHSGIYRQSKACIKEAYEAGVMEALKAYAEVRKAVPYPERLGQQ